MSLHIPSRPLWLCAVDGAPWPCENRRRQLLGEFVDGGPVALRAFMARWMADAALDLPDAFAAELTAQFLSWIPQDGWIPRRVWLPRHAAVYQAASVGAGR